LREEFSGGSDEGDFGGLAGETQAAVYDRRSTGDTLSFSLGGHRPPLQKNTSGLVPEFFI